MKKSTLISKHHVIWLQIIRDTCDLFYDERYDDSTHTCWITVDIGCIQPEINRLGQSSAVLLYRCSFYCMNDKLVRPDGLAHSVITNDTIRYLELHLSGEGNVALYATPNHFLCTLYMNEIRWTKFHQGGVGGMFLIVLHISISDMLVLVVCSHLVAWFYLVASLFFYWHASISVMFVLVAVTILVALFDLVACFYIGNILIFGGMLLFWWHESIWWHATNLVCGIQILTKMIHDPTVCKEPRPDWSASILRAIQSTEMARAVLIKYSYAPGCKLRDQTSALRQCMEATTLFKSIWNTERWFDRFLIVQYMGRSRISHGWTKWREVERVSCIFYRSIVFQSDRQGVYHVHGILTLVSMAYNVACIHCGNV